MQTAFYQLDAFADRPFGGNPAAVCPLDAWLPDPVLLAIAQENNLSETAFFVPDGTSSAVDYHLRWFTPAAEIDLCGHATLASAAVVFRHLHPEWNAVTFGSMSGPLIVRRDEEGEWLELDFPARPAHGEIPVTPELVATLGARPDAVLDGERDLYAVFADAETVRSLTPDIAAIAAGPGSIVVTAPGDDDETAYVCRMFAPAFGVPEDPVTGSIQCTLAPYWAGQLGTTILPAKQVSTRGGALRVTLAGDRVRIGGQAIFVIEGTFTLPDA
ncbi:MAG: PhzF family phenazine biosynthesis protein [Thermomicrobiales bacterium]